MRILHLKRFKSWREILDLIFHPMLWCLPFLGLTILSVFQISMQGVYGSKFGFETQGRAYSSINVLYFSLLWLWSMFAFSKLKFDRMARVYLSFCVIFSAYGVGELIGRVFIFSSLVEQYGFFATAKGMMYPLFFVYNHVPLYLFLNGRKNSFFPIFLVLQGAHAFLCIMHFSGVLGALATVFGVYYLARGLAVSMYAILLLGFYERSSRGTG